MDTKCRKIFAKRGVKPKKVVKTGAVVMTRPMRKSQKEE
jgi:hypothetical protein